MLLVFSSSHSLDDNKLHGIDYAVVALLGISVLLLTAFWIGKTSSAKSALGRVHLVWRTHSHGRSAGPDRNHQDDLRSVGKFDAGWKWWLALARCCLIYFYAHYVFASITAHVTAMFTPFLIVILAAERRHTSRCFAALLLQPRARLTHYGTHPHRYTSAPATHRNEPGGRWD
jgi:DASS family divalent anion:Na+ symporter